MLTFKSDPAQRQALGFGDLKALKDILEAESAKADTKLRETAAADDFRFWQGVSQTLGGIMKLLP